jgi:hypothetical protein
MLAIALSGCASREKPGVVLPTARRASAPKDGPRGRDRGDIEIALGAVTTAVAATLVVFGAVNAYRASYVREYCSPSNGPILELPDPERESTCTDPLGMDPFVSATVSSALAFAFAVPIAAGGGILLRNGIRLRRAYQKANSKQVSLRPWLDAPRGGAGLSLSLRF